MRLKRLIPVRFWVRRCRRVLCRSNEIHSHHLTWLGKIALGRCRPAQEEER